MGHSIEGLCSKALVLLGANSIAKIDEGSTEAEICSNIYEIITCRMLCYPWSFALKSAQLARVDGTPLFGYKYLYALPSDFLMAKGLFEENSRHLHSEEYQYLNGKISTDAEKPVLNYICRIKEENFPEYFATALIYRLASDFAMPLTGNSETASYWDKKAEMESRRARNIDSQQKTSISFVNTGLIDVRR